MLTRLVRDYPWHVAIAVAFSLLFSLWALWLDDVVNNDGVEYLYAAIQAKNGNWASMFAQYKWPFYPMLIAWIAQVFSIGLDAAAYLLNAILYSVLIIAFLAVVREFGGNKNTLTIAVLIALLHPELNDYRSFVIRDIGYLAFYLFAVGYFVRFYKHHSWKAAVFALLSLVLATLFRIEGFVFLTLIPFAFLGRRSTNINRRITLSIVIILALIAVITVFGWWMFSPTEALSYQSILDKPLAIVYEAWGQVEAVLDEKVRLVERELLSKHSEDYAYVVLLFAAIIIVLTESLKTVSLVHGALAIYGYKKQLLFPASGVLNPWMLLVIVNGFILLIFAVTQLFLAPRYPLALATTLLIAVPFVLEYLYEMWRSQNKPRSWGFPTIVILLALIGFESLDLRTNKQHLKQAGLWVGENIDPEQELYTNDKILAYYTGRTEQAVTDDHPRRMKQILLQVHNAWWRHDVLALRIRADLAGARDVVTHHVRKLPLKTFSNGKGDVVLIFETNR